MTYEEAKHIQELENKNKIDSDTPKDFDKYGKTEMGLTQIISNKHLNGN